MCFKHVLRVCVFKYVCVFVCVLRVNTPEFKCVFMCVFKCVCVCLCACVLSVNVCVWSVEGFL